MPNGKQGDHPLTDIVSHGMDILGDGLDADTRILCKARPDLREQVADLLWDRAPVNGAQLDPAGRGALRKELERLAAKPVTGA